MIKRKVRHSFAKRRRVHIYRPNKLSLAWIAMVLFLFGNSPVAFPDQPIVTINPAAKSPLDVRVVSFSPDGKMIVIADYLGNVELWDAQTHQFVAKTNSVPALLCVAFSLDSSLLAVGGSQSLEILAVPKLNVVFECQARADEIVFLKDGKTMLVKGSHDRISGILFWNLIDFKPINARTIAPRFEGDIAISPDSKMLITAPNLHPLYGRAPVRVWDVATGKISSRQLGIQLRFGTQFEFSPNGKFLAMVLDETTLEIWSTATWTPRTRVNGGDVGGFRLLAFSPDSRRIACSNYNGAAVYDVNTGKCVKRIKKTDIFPASFSPTNGNLAIGVGNTVELWDIPDDLSQPNN